MTTQKPTGESAGARMQRRSMGHFIDRCKHGTVMAQCRCPDKNKREGLAPCGPECPAPEPKPDAQAGTCDHNWGPAYIPDGPEICVKCEILRPIPEPVQQQTAPGEEGKPCRCRPPFEGVCWMCNPPAGTPPVPAEGSGFRMMKNTITHLRSRIAELERQAEAARKVAVTACMWSDAEQYGDPNPYRGELIEATIRFEAARQKTEPGV